MRMSYIKTEEEILREIKNVLEKNSEESEKGLVKAINDSERIFVAGAGRSGLMGKSFAMRLMQLGIKSFVVGETTTPAIQKGDLLVAVSGSGKTKSVLGFIEEAKKANAKIACITAEKESPAAKKSNTTIILKGKTRAGGKSVEPMGSLFEQSALIFFDAVIIGLMKQKGKKEKEMGNRHASLE